MFRKLILATFFVLAVGLAEIQAADVVWDRALYWDDRYPSAWAGGAVTIRDALQAAGYTTLNADQLKTWMNGHIADKKLSVVVFCRDSAPDTVAETMSATCTLRKYLDAGGKIVWYSDIPFYYQGHADGSNTTWGDAGGSAVLGFNAASAPRDTYNTVTLTNAGIAWGLTQTWQSQRPTGTTITNNLTVLATDSAGNAAAWAKHYVPGDNYRGFVRLYDTTGVPPNADDVMRVAEYAATKASGPSPANGAILSQTWVSLTWTPGALAVSHDVYFGDNFDDVNAGTGDTFRGNQTQASFVAGFLGVPYPDGLVPGTTYYWRIDEVDPANIFRGPVWSFTVPPRKAYAPSPRSGAKYVDTAPTLSWNPGLNAKLHYVYFGDNLDTVSNATIAPPRGTTTYTPAGPLVKGKMYYWRVDEFDAAATYKGDVWSFTTLPDIPITDPNLVGWYKFEAGEGTKIIDFSGHGNHGTIVPGTGGTVQWVEGMFNMALQFLGDDRGHVDLPPRVVAPTKGSVMMWVNTNQIDDEGMLWYGTAAGGDGYTNTDNEIHLNIDDPGQVDFYLGGGNGVTIDGPFINGAGWTHLAATWDLTDGVRLYVNGAQAGSAAHTGLNTNLAIIRLGRPVATGNGNRYYEGLMDDVRLFNHAISAAKVAEIMNKGEDPLRAGSPKPATGALAPINVATSLSWTRGEKASQHDVYFGLDKAAVANATASDTTGIYRGRQSATSYTPPEGVQFNGGPYYWRVDEVNTDGTITAGGLWSFSVADYALVEDFESYNDIAAGQAGSNLVYMTWLDGFGTTTNGSTMGYPTGSSLETANVHGGGKAVPLIYNNSTASFSEVERTLAAQNWTSNGIQTLSLWFRGASTNVPGQLYVKINGVKVPYDGDAGNLKKPVWQIWNITLASAGVNLQSVTRLAVGIETKGASGTLLLDDIRLYPLPRQLITPVQPDPAGLAARFAFDGNANDSAGGHNGTPNGGPLYALGKIGQAISLDGVDDYVAVSSVGISGAAPRTIAGWAKMNVTTGITDWTNVFGFSATGSNDLHFDIEVVGGGTTTAGYYGIHVYGWERNIMPPDLGWHHFAATYDGTTISWYGDGLLIGSAAHPGLNTQGDVRIGKRIDTGGFFPGLVDEVQIFSRVLSEAEVAGLAGMTLPFDKPL